MIAARVSTERQPSPAVCGAVLVALVTLALALRLWTLEFGLPYQQEPDPHILGQIETLAQPKVTDEDLFYSSIYPHFLARTTMLFGDVVTPPSSERLAEMSLVEHQVAAAQLHLRVRQVIAWLSVLIIPATFWLATFFVERGWALLAASFATLSTLSLQFGQQARPHAAVASLIALAVASCIHLRRRGDLRAFVIAGALCALAIACLTNALAVLLPAALAYAMRDGARRRILDPKLLVPFALLALAIRIYYPFLFVERPANAVVPEEEGAFSLAWQTINWNDFRGAGFPTLFMTLWYYEPAASALALVGVAAWLLRKSDGSPAWSARRKDLLVALSFALVYALVIGLQRRNQQRFVLPLVPFLCALSGYGMRAVAQRLGVLPARALAVVALAVPAWASFGYTRMRSSPHTLEQLAEWIETQHASRAARVALHLVWDVPLVREHDNLFDAAGAKRKMNFSPWLRYQQDHLDPHWRGARFDVEALYPERERWPAIAADPRTYLNELAADFVVLPAGDGVGVTALTRALRAELQRMGAPVLALPAEARPPVSGLEGLDTPHFTLFVSTARWFGPQLEVYRVPRSR